MITKVSKAAAAVLDYLVEQAKSNDGHIRIDNNNYNPAEGGIMPVCVEMLGDNRVSVAHYYTQNGDAMRDPEVVYWIKDGEYYPCEHYQDGVIFISTDLITFDCEDKPIRYNPRAQRYTAVFSTTWMQNIKEQQGLKISPRKKSIA